MVSAKSNPRKGNNFIGDNQNLNLASENGEKLTVVGNNCTVKVTKNEGSVKIIGNNNTISVMNGSGTLHCIGNNGSVALYKNVPKKSVTYVGSNGRISVISEDGRREEKCCKSDPKIRVKVNSGVQIPRIDLNLDCGLIGRVLRTQVESSSSKARKSKS